MGPCCWYPAVSCRRCQSVQVTYILQYSLSLTTRAVRAFTSFSCSTWALVTLTTTKEQIILTDYGTTMTAQRDHVVTAAVFVHVELFTDLPPSNTLQPVQTCELCLAAQ